MTETPVSGEFRELKDELLAAIAESRTEMQRGLAGIRSEIAGLRQAVEILADKLLHPREAEEVRRAATG